MGSGKTARTCAPPFTFDGIASSAAQASQATKSGEFGAFAISRHQVITAKKRVTSIKASLTRASESIDNQTEVIPR
jgi:hypothetical protein